MEAKDFIVIAIGLAILMPVAGITVRIALKPIVDSVARLMEMRASMNASELMERRVTLLEQEMQILRAENSRLIEEREFYNRLESH